MSTSITVNMIHLIENMKLERKRETGAKKKIWGT